MNRAAEPTTAVRTSREAANRAGTTARREAIAHPRAADIAAAVVAEAAITVVAAGLLAVATRTAAEDMAAIANR